MAKKYIPFLKILLGFSILTPTPPSYISRIAVVTCLRNRDYLDSQSSYKKKQVFLNRKSVTQPSIIPTGLHIIPTETPLTTSLRG